MRTMSTLLVAALLSPLAHAGDGGLPGRQEIESLLKSRLPLKLIEERCTPERRSTKGVILLLNGPGAVKAQFGQLYAGRSNRIDKISWFTEFRGDELTYYVEARKDGAIWIVDSGHEKELRQPLTAE
jgi:hypothetical protein